MRKITLKRGLSLPSLQSYIAQVDKERGWEKDTVVDKFIILTEELGELSKAIRKTKTNLKSDPNSKMYEVEDESADVLFVLLNLCNKLGIDLEKALLQKEKKNIKRKWS